MHIIVELLSQKTTFQKALLAAPIYIEYLG